MEKILLWNKIFLVLLFVAIFLIAYDIFEWISTVVGAFFIARWGVLKIIDLLPEGENEVDKKSPGKNK